MNPPLTPDDPRLVALALGEVRDPAEHAALEAAVAADPALAAALAEHRKLAGGLRAAFAREPLPFVNPEAVATRAMSGNPALRTARRGSGLTVVPRSKSEPRRLAFYTTVGLAAAACLAFVLVTRSPEKPVTVAETPAPAVPVRPFAAGASATFSAKVLAGRLPGLRGADNAFHAPGRGALALAAPYAREYASALGRELAAGRRPGSGTLRVDGLVNAFVAARPIAPGNRAVLVETALTDAPWNAAHRLLRVTVRAQGATGETVARNVAANIDFAASGVKSWRILGHDGKPAATTGIALHAGDTVTTLYEIEPAVGKELATVALRYSPASGTGLETVSSSVDTAARRALADTDSDTRFAAALAAYALDLGDNPAAGLAPAAGADSDRLAFASLVK